MAKVIAAAVPGLAFRPEPARPPATDLRTAGPAALEVALRALRAELLGLFDGFVAALGEPGLRIGYDPVLNLPLWELGHIGWFEEHWLARNDRQRHLGAACPHDAPRGASLRRDADRLYDSARVAHRRRWELALPTPAETGAYLADVRASTLERLRRSDAGDDALYFFRLVLFHESMHVEAWHFMAQRLGIDLGPAMRGRAPTPLAADAAAGTGTGTAGTGTGAGGAADADADADAAREWAVPSGIHRIGHGGPGFAFDNEREAFDCRLEGFSIDRGPVTWQRYLPFIEDGGYRRAGFWSEAGWAWRQRQSRAQPKHLRPDGGAGGGWEQERFGRWSALDPRSPVLQVSCHEAEAWCRWAGRRLPTEFEWEAAARHADEGRRFDWGQVWEWTSSPFAPYSGFVPHPYRDYSVPWFDGRPVLRGGSFATAAPLRDPTYRNFFPADRDDVFTGFRSCATG